MYSKTQNSFFSTGDFCRTPGVLDLFPTSAAPSPDCGGIGFMEESGGYTKDGFVSCTEALGCESSDERISGDGLVAGTETHDRSTILEREKRRTMERKKVVELPPPLTSFDKNGRRDFILRPVRKDGRLQLTEVKIHRPEIMYATREDGRLTLRLVGDEDEEDEIEEEEEEEENTAETGDSCLNEEDDEVEDGGDCRSQAIGEGGEAAALRRCYEYEVAGQQNLWSPRFVTTM